MITDEQRVMDLCCALLSECPPAETDPLEFLGRQFDAGLAWVQFPEGFGGLGLAPQLQSVVSATLVGAGGPDPSRRNPIGYGMAAPTLIVHGSEALKRRHLRPLFTCEEIWCQLFSEPGAGSDLAGVATRAELDGDVWVVNGQKVWTSLAHEARWGTIVVRTDPDQPKHRGLSFFVVDMHAPGVEVKPLFQITGEAEFNEVFLSDVRIPNAWRLGDVGAGWQVSLTTLMNERMAVGGLAEEGSGIIDVGATVDLWKARGGGGVVARDELVRLWIEAEVARLTASRASHARAAGTPGPEGSLGKVAVGELNKRITTFNLGLLGAEGMLKPNGYSMQSGVYATSPTLPQDAFLRARANSIEGGTTEIAKNVIGERVLGLPADVRVDKDVPWREVPRS